MKKKKKKLTNTANAITATIMDIPQSCGKSSISFLATKTQKTAMGAATRNTVNKIDLASGPKISLPPQRNI